MSKQIKKQVELTRERVLKISEHILGGASKAESEGFDQFEVVAGTQFCLGVMLADVGIKIDLNAPVSEALPLLALGINLRADKPQQVTTH